MEFSTILFIELFLPISVILYYILFSIIKNIKVLNVYLLIISILFYGFSGIYNILYLLIVITINYLLGLFISKRKSKLWFVLGVILNVFSLAFYKYAGLVIQIKDAFLTNNLIDGLMLINGDVETNIIAPVAISFITFKNISYLYDIYKDKYSVEKNYINYALFVSFFPCLIQGPIISYDEFSPFFKDRTHSIDNVVYGLKRFSYGLAKKVIIANTVALVVGNIFYVNPNELGTLICWVGALLYTIQIYFDFSGYSDMAVGIGKLFGFSVKENFNYPYTSLSIKEFWNRWHISLSEWFKKYIYIPMGGNRKGKVKQIFNLFTVFLITGVWHGANLTFIVWGLYFGVLRIIEVLFLDRLLKKNKVKILNWIYVMISVMVGWVLFRSNNLAYAFNYIKGMFTFSKPVGDIYLTNYLSIEIILVIFGGICLSGFVQKLFGNFYKKHQNKKWMFWIDSFIQLILLAISICLIVAGSFTPSIYTKF